MKSAASVLMQDPVLGTGRVQAVRAGACMVVGQLGMVRARRAASCLLEPQDGDLVLLMLGESANYVLHVLEREEGPAHIMLPPDTSITTMPTEGKNSALRLHADTLTLHSQRDIHMQTDALSAHAATLSLHAGVLRMTGEVLQRRFASVRDVFVHAYTRVGKAVGIFGKRVERVDDVLDTQAGRVRLTACESVRVRARDTDIRSSESVTVDGKHIHIG